MKISLHHSTPSLIAVNGKKYLYLEMSTPSPRGGVEEGGENESPRSEKRKEGFLEPCFGHQNSAQ